MEENKILEKLQEIFVDVLDEEDIVISMETSMENTDEWDSLAHLMLIAEIENQFGFKFKMEQVSKVTSVQKLIQTIKENI